MSFFFSPALADGLLLEFEWHQISWTLLSVLGDRNNGIHLFFDF